MLSIGRSSLTRPVQLVFLCTNGLGLLLGAIYHSKTPDLYENNAHHRLGWVVTGIVSAQVMLGLFQNFAGAATVKYGIPISQYQGLQRLREEDSYRYSRESANDLETTSPQSPSLISLHERERVGLLERHAPDTDNPEKSRIMHGSVVNRFWSQHMPQVAGPRALSVIDFSYNFIDRTSLILGFLAITTGVVTYGGLFVSIFVSQNHFLTDWI